MTGHGSAMRKSASGEEAKKGLEGAMDRRKAVALVLPIFLAIASAAIPLLLFVSEVLSFTKPVPG